MAVDRDTYRSLVLGPEATAFKKQASRAQWNAIKKRAHKRGLSVDQFLRNTRLPEPLRELGKKQIKKQATDTIRSAYAPALQELSQREERVKALDSKRAADAEYYNNWLSAKLTKFEADAAVRDQAVRDTATGIQSRQKELWEQQNAALKARDEQRGTTSLPGGPTDLEIRGGFEQQGVGVHAGNATNTVAAGASLRDVTRASVLAQRAAADAQRSSETWAALKDVADERLKAKFAQGADIAKEISRLLEGETAKAQYNQQYQTAVAELDIKGQEASRKAGESRSKARDRTRKYKLDVIKAQNAVDKADADRALKDDQFSAKYGVSRKTWRSWGDKQKQDYLKRARARGVIGDKGSSTTKPKPPTAEARKQGLNTINGVRNIVSRLGKWRQYIANGGNPPPGVMAELRANYDSLLINVALDVLRYNGQLRPGTARSLLEQLRGTGVKSPWKKQRSTGSKGATDHPRT